MARVDLAPKFHGGQPGFSLKQKERVVESPTHPESRVKPFWTSFITRPHGVIGKRQASEPRFKVTRSVRARSTTPIALGVNAQKRDDFIAGSSGVGTSNGKAILPSSEAGRLRGQGVTAKPGIVGRTRGPFGLTQYTRGGKITPLSENAAKIFGRGQYSKQLKNGGTAR